MLRIGHELVRRFGSLGRYVVQRAQPAAERPVVFMHIPKTGGSALISELRDTLAPVQLVHGLDRCLFGGFDAFDSLGEVERGLVFTDPAELPQNAHLVVGHMAFSTLRAIYPSGQFVTVLREPVSRLLSHWNYWRAWTDDALAGWGAWGDVVRQGQKSLAVFLDDPSIASSADNVAVRMLLWPHPLIPDDDFIDPAHDDVLVREACARLRQFSLVDIVESPGREALRAWCGLPIGKRRENETPPARPDHCKALHAELTPFALDRLDACSRLDLRLWQSVGLARMGKIALDQLRSRQLLVTVSRHAALLSGSVGGGSAACEAAHAAWQSDLSAVA